MLSWSPAPTASLKAIAINNPAHQYALDVTAGEIPACKWVRLACKRFLDDLKRDFAYRYDESKAAAAVKFIQALPHVKGQWATRKEKIVLEPWQAFIVCNIFGWVHKETGLRRFMKASLYVGRKNGKSLFAAAIGLYMLVADSEAGAEVYSGATSEKQAWEVFGPARKMAERTPEMQAYYGLEVNASNLNTPFDGSKFEPIIGNPGDGASPHCAIVDEYHEHKDSKQYDTMLTGMGARQQPLMLVITTAGDNIAGPCFDDMQTVEKILEGVIEDGRHFGIIYTVDASDDWTAKETLYKANPNIGVSISEEFLLARQKEAIENSRHQGRFKTKHLNIWVSARDAFFNVEKWTNCGDPVLKMADFIGKPCIVALDLASKRDIAAMIFLFYEDETVTSFGRYYLPESAIEKEENNHYRAWAADGYLVVTDGDMIDLPRIQEDLIDYGSHFDIEEIAYDPWQATQMIINLMEHGATCIEYKPTVNNFSDPMKHLDGMIHAKTFKHDNNPAMTWMISNVVAKIDAKDNVYPRKERQELKIDGPVALIMAVGRWLTKPQDGPSIYEDPGVEVWVS